jgi:hypothetical protein
MLLLTSGLPQLLALVLVKLLLLVVTFLLALVLMLQRFNSYGNITVGTATVGGASLGNVANATNLVVVTTAANSYWRYCW